jgi:hypothetical protein
LCDDGAKLEEERRFVVTEANEVEQQLSIAGSDDLLVVVRPFTPDSARAEAVAQLLASSATTTVTSEYLYRAAIEMLQWLTIEQDQFGAELFELRVLLSNEPFAEASGRRRMESTVSLRPPPGSRLRCR